MRRASSSDRRCSTMSRPTWKATRKRFSALCCRSSARDDFEDRGPPAERASVRQRRRDLHPQRPRRARIRGARECRHGRHQRADPGAGRLSQLRRLEALGLRRHQPARHGRREVLDQGQDDHPALARRFGRTAATRSSSRRWGDRASLPPTASRPSRRSGTRRTITLSMSGRLSANSVSARSMCRKSRAASGSEGSKPH
jgi:hypothetical protein